MAALGRCHRQARRGQPAGLSVAPSKSGDHDHANVLAGRVAAASVMSGRLPLQELAYPREHVQVGVLAHDGVQVPVTGEDLELMAAGRDL